MRARILIPDPANRWKFGDTGNVQQAGEDSWYDYYVTLDGTVDICFLGKVIKMTQTFSFHKDEIEILP